MSEWKKVSLDQMGTVSRGKSKHRPRNDARLFGGKYPFIQTGDISSAGLYVNEFSQTYNEEGLAQSKLWEKDTLCITIAANIADTALLAFPACFPDSIMGFVADPKKSNVKFVKYCFDILQKDCKQISQGAAQDNLSWKKLSTIEFPCPPIEVQNRIATILSRYDSLIENYQKQIKLLEEAAQRLYKEWFIDLHFPGHENTNIIDGVPEGWEKKKVGEIAKVNANSISKTYPYSTIEYIDLGSVREGRIFEKTPYHIGEEPGRAKRIAKDGDVIWGMVRPNLKSFALVMNPNATEVYSTGFAILSALSVPFTFLYCSVTTDAFVGYLVNCTNGAAYPAVKAEHFINAEITVPTNALLDEFGRITIPMYRKMEKISTQLRLLTEARDRLLPKLMSGAIEV